MSSVSTFSRSLDRIGLVATFILPLGLTHLRGIAEVCIDVLAIGLLFRSVIDRSWTWARAPWCLLSLLWWGWQVLCSMPVAPFGAGGWGGFLQSLAAVRFPVMVAALQTWTLRDRRVLSWMIGLISACCLYIAFQLLVQAATGHNLFGVPRFHDGTLTGPYRTPRAAAPLSRLALPTLMLGGALIGTRWSGLRATLALSALAVFAVALMVLAGQRMPLALFVLGIAVCAALYKPMRPAFGVAALLAPVLIGASALVSKQGFFHLVVLAQSQFAHFRISPYGRIFMRAAVMAQANPVTGLGYDAFRHGCANPAYFREIGWLGGVVDDLGGGSAICVQHAHNHYLEALTNAGLPGLGLFCAMIGGWLVTLWPLPAVGSRSVQAFRIGVFAAVLVQEWPFASASDFMNLPLAGWSFLLLGVGLAATHSPQTGRQMPVWRTS